MRPGTTLIAVAGLSLLPTVSFGQSYSYPSQPQPSYSQPAFPSAAGPDVAYCQALSNLYARYIGHDWQYGNYSRKRANNDAQVAMTQCQRGETASAIPVLERELRANKITLPTRG
jgi:hypothetical protein